MHVAVAGQHDEGDARDELLCRRFAHGQAHEIRDPGDADFFVFEVGEEAEDLGQVLHVNRPLPASVEALDGECLLSGKGPEIGQAFDGIEPRHEAMLGNRNADGAGEGQHGRFIFWHGGIVRRGQLDDPVPARAGHRNGQAPVLADEREEFELDARQRKPQRAVTWGRYVGRVIRARACRGSPGHDSHRARQVVAEQPEQVEFPAGWTLPRCAR